jgi:hypothetical protein
MSQNCGTLSLFFYCPLYHHLGGNHFHGQCLVCVRVNEMKCFDSQPTSFVLRNQYNCSNLNLLPNSLRVPFVVLCRARIRFVLYTNSFFCAELPAAPALSRQDQARIGGVLYTNSHMRAKSASPPSIILQS